MSSTEPESSNPEVRDPKAEDQPVAGSAESTSDANSQPSTPPAEGDVDVQAVKEECIAQLKTVFDPEIPVNIYELGMIYDVRVEPDGATYVRMTLTTPSCPAAGTLPAEAQAKVADVEGVTEVKVDLVWDPPWTPDMMSEAAKLQTGMF